MKSHIDYIDNEVGRKKGLFHFLSLKLVAVSALFIGCIFAFGLITHEVIFEKERELDDDVFRFFDKISSPGLIHIMKFFTFFGSAGFLISAYSFLVTYFIARRKYRYGIHIAILSLSSTLLMFAIKSLTQRKRPEVPIIKGITNFSFPSGHALGSFILCSIFIYIIWHGRLSAELKWLYSVLLILFSITIGVSRIVLKVHYPTDVLASFSLGLVWVILSFWVLRTLTKRDALKIKSGAH